MKYRDMQPEEIDRIGEVNRRETVGAEYVTRTDGSGLGLVTTLVERSPPEEVPPWGEQGTERRVRKWRPALEGGGHLHGAFEGERLIGFALLGPRQRDGSGEVVALFVDCDHRRKGVAGTLMAWARQKARDEEMTSLFLYSNATESSVGFYLSQGFQIVGLISRELVKSLSEDIVMAMTLDRASP